MEKITLEKQKLRLLYKRKRDQISAVSRRKAGRAVEMCFTKHPELLAFECVGVYLSRGSELETRPLIERLLRLKKIVALPYLKTSSSPLEFRRIQRLDDCVSGPFGIYQPRASCRKINLAKLDLLLVPGMAFDRRGARLGYGGGFFDRALALARPKRVLGLTYEKCIAKILPRAPHDISVDGLLTEKRLLLDGK